MVIRMPAVQTAIFSLSMLCFWQASCAQFEGRSAFEQICKYAGAFQTLASQFESNESAKAQLLRERDDIVKALDETAADFNRVSAQGIANQFQLVESRLALSALQQEIRPFREASSAQSAVGGLPPPGRSLYGALLTRSTLETLNEMVLRDQSRQLDAEAKLTVERRLKLLMSAVGLRSRAQAAVQNDLKLVEQYVDLADMAATRSKLELSAAMRELDDRQTSNIGATLSVGITLMRLGRLEDAKQRLDEPVLNTNLILNTNIVRPLVLAARGELLARLGDKSGSEKHFAEAHRFASAQPLIYLMRAHAHAVLNDPKKSLESWEQLLKSGKHEVATHRGIALVCCAFSPGETRYQKLAMEHAKLSDALTGGAEWSCQIALALATAASGDFLKASDIAEQAAKNAVGDRRSQCARISAELKAGVIPAWDF